MSTEQFCRTHNYPLAPRHCYVCDGHGERYVHDDDDWRGYVSCQNCGGTGEVMDCEICQEDCV